MDIEEQKALKARRNWDRLYTLQAKAGWSGEPINKWLIKLAFGDGAFYGQALFHLYKRKCRRTIPMMRDEIRLLDQRLRKGDDVDSNRIGVFCFSLGQFKSWRTHRMLVEFSCPPYDMVTRTSAVEAMACKGHIRDHNLIQRYAGPENEEGIRLEALWVIRGYGANSFHRYRDFVATAAKDTSSRIRGAAAEALVSARLQEDRALLNSLIDDQGAAMFGGSTVAQLAANTIEHWGWADQLEDWDED